MDNQELQYAKWLNDNKDKAGTEEYNYVSRAYSVLRGINQGGNAGDVGGGEVGGGGEADEPFYHETLSKYAPISDRPFGLEESPKVKYGKDEAGRNIMTNLETGVTYTQNAQGQFDEPLALGYMLGKAIEFIPGGLATQDPQSFTRGLEYARNALLSPSFQRAAPPLVAAFAFPPSAIGTGPSLTLSAIAGLAGSNTAGDPLPEQVKNMLYSAFMGGTRAKEASSLLKTLGWEIPKEVGVAAGYATGVELVGRGLEAGRPVLFDSGTDWAKSVGPMAVFGTFTGAVKGYGANASYYARKVDATRRELGDFLGLDNITLGIVDPEQFAQVEGILAESNPELARKIRELGKNTEKRYAALFGDVPTTTEVADKLNRYAGRVKEETDALAVLEKAKAEADAEVVRARRVNLSPEKIAEVEQDAIAAEMAIINQRARVNFWSRIQANEAGIITDLNNSINNFQDGVNEIFNARKRAANSAYGSIGINQTERIFDKNQLADAAQAALANRDSAESRAIVDYIRNYAGKEASITLNELREMRKGIASVLEGADPRKFTSSEAMANAAYSAVLDKTNQIINKRFGEEVANKFKDVNSWYSRTLAAENSPFSRGLINKNPKDTVLAELAENVSNGNMQSSKDFFRWLDVLAEQSPDIANEGRTLYYAAVRDGFLKRATQGRSTIDFNTLSTELNNAAVRGFPVEMLGFGNKKQISNVAAAFKKYSGGKVTAQEIDEFYSNPLVQTELAAGRDLSGLAKVQASKNAWLARVKEDAVRDAIGARAKNSEFDVLEKEKLAKAAQLSVEEQQRLIAGLREDPLMQAFYSSSAGMPSKFGPEAGAITDWMMKMAPGDLNEVMRAMRRSRPDIAAEVSQRVSTDIFASLFKPKKGGGFFIDPDMLGQILNPPISGDRGNANRMLRSVLTPDEYKRFASALPAFERLSRYYAQGGTAPIGKDLQTMIGATIALSLGRTGAVSGYSGFTGHVGFLIRSQKYRILSRMLIDKDFANAYSAYIIGGTLGSRLANERQMQRLAILLQSDKELASEVESGGNQ